MVRLKVPHQVISCLFAAKWVDYLIFFTHRALLLGEYLFQLVSPSFLTMLRKRSACKIFCISLGIGISQCQINQSFLCFLKLPLSLLMLRKVTICNTQASSNLDSIEKFLITARYGILNTVFKNLSASLLLLCSKKFKSKALIEANILRRLTFQHSTNCQLFAIECLYLGILP